ncbi:alpha-ketoacid dehydrogenase subunit beta [Mycoplasma zalophi]|uniref:Alpha-ketoacid dehydrogenase subunit beta n=1 Tax=Mycoplasma zalophi TaxID=191287 RepID=A0ABS6DPN2_9MOLU|nr:alpha-ketoacid dehydrogenase subunit beta [Mycoplasma zalophi]MBU4690983.1 alpha-ketoacid dehydrogenase subunit beta [Mycoplasma zalophi]MBU4692238.1 alpha-ketoacid dehydrogenase subunit beta [Mycoplasma zalophi]
MSDKKITVNNIGALNQALKLMFAKDERYVLYGEDAGFEGGVFRATEGLQQEFGSDRVWDSPISESAIAGTAIGAAVAGLRPVVEFQFSGFSWYALAQICTNAARMRNRTRGKYSVPAVFRMPAGGGVKALEHHSESIETIYSHIPGLTVVMPSTPYNTKGLMIAAMESEDPVIFLEHKRDYRAFKQEIPEGYYKVELGKANVIVEGSDLTVVTYGHMVHETLAALKQLNEEGFEGSVEVIDLQTLKPMDTETIVNSVKKTGKVIAVTEAVSTLSIASEIITRVNEHCFDDLKAAPVRLAGPDVTIPLPALEPLFMVDAKKIAHEIKELYKK